MDTSSASEPSTPDHPPVKVLPSRARAPWSTWRAIQTVFSIAILVATLFTIWTPNSLFSSSLAEKMAIALQSNPKPGGTSTFPTATARPSLGIGIVAGHWGNDSGSVCPDGLTEQEVNLKIATLVQQQLTAQGFQVDLMHEFDPKLEGYLGLVLVSIHNDSCNYINDQATGFKVAAALSSSNPEQASRLTACLADRYGKITGLKFHYNSITPDMTQYHAFSEINSNTPAAIIETGFLNLDRQILTEKTDLVAQGVTAGIICFIRNESIQDQVTQPTP